MNDLWREIKSEYDVARNALWDYPCLHNENLLSFDVDFYKIVCSSISVESVEGTLTDEESKENWNLTPVFRN